MMVWARRIRRNDLYRLIYLAHYILLKFFELQSDLTDNSIRLQRSTNVVLFSILFIHISLRLDASQLKDYHLPKSLLIHELFSINFSNPYQLLLDYWSIFWQRPQHNQKIYTKDTNMSTKDHLHLHHCSTTAKNYYDYSKRP